VAGRLWPHHPYSLIDSAGRLRQPYNGVVTAALSGVTAGESVSAGQRNVADVANRRLSQPLAAAGGQPTCHHRLAAADNASRPAGWQPNRLAARTSSGSMTCIDNRNIVFNGLA